MKSKLILCLAFVLSGFFSASGQTAVARSLYVHFGDEGSRLLSAQIHLGEAIFVGGQDYLELKGSVEQRGTNLVADLMGNTGSQSQFYRGNVILEKPFFAQGGAASGGAGGGYWFAISTNWDCRTILEHVNEVMGLTNAPFSHPAAILPPLIITNVPNQIDPVTGLSLQPKRDKQP